MQPTDRPMFTVTEVIDRFQRTLETGAMPQLPNDPHGRAVFAAILGYAALGANIAEASTQRHTDEVAHVS